MEVRFLHLCAHLEFDLFVPLHLPSSPSPPPLLFLHVLLPSSGSSLRSPWAPGSQAATLWFPLMVSKCVQSVLICGRWAVSCCNKHVGDTWPAWNRERALPCYEQTPWRLIAVAHMSAYNLGTFQRLCPAFFFFTWSVWCGWCGIFTNV